MAKFTIILWEHDQLKDGSYPVKLRVTIGNSRKYIALDLYARTDQWDSKESKFIEKKAINPKYKEYNKKLEEYDGRRKEVVRDFELQKIDWTLNQFEDAFLHRGKRGSVFNWQNESCKFFRTNRVYLTVYRFINNRYFLHNIATFVL